MRKGRKVSETQRIAKWNPGIPVLSPATDSESPHPPHTSAGETLSLLHVHTLHSLPSTLVLAPAIPLPGKAFPAALPMQIPPTF